MRRRAGRVRSSASRSARRRATRWEEQMRSLFDDLPGGGARPERAPRRERDPRLEREPRPERRVLTVSELNAWARATLEAEIPLVWVEGEISNLRRYPSGHTYFTLKDAAAQVSAVLFRGQADRVRFRPEDGQKVLVRGRVGLYEA